MSELPTFHAEEMFKISGRGLVFVGRSWLAGGRDEISRSLVGSEILIEGSPLACPRVFRITGVEMFRPMSPLRVGEQIGLLVA